MNIYIDEIILENLFVNVSVIYLLYLFTKSKLNVFKMTMASIFLSVIAVVKVLDITNNLLIQILSVNIIIYLLFKPRCIITYFKYIIYFFIIYVEYIGITIFLIIFFNINIEFIHIRLIIYIVTFTCTYIINNYMWKLWISLFKNNDLKYKLVLNNEYSFNVMLDTGNYIKDSLNIYDVFIISKDSYLKELNKRKKDESMFNKLKYKNLEEVEIKVNTAIGGDILKGYIFNNIKIVKNNREILKLNKAIIILLDNDINNGKIDGIIGYYTYINKLGGVVL